MLISEPLAVIRVWRLMIPKPWRIVSGSRQPRVVMLTIIRQTVVRLVKVIWTRFLILPRPCGLIAWWTLMVGRCRLIFRQWQWWGCDWVTVIPASVQSNFLGSVRLTVVPLMKTLVLPVSVRTPVVLRKIKRRLQKSGGRPCCCSGGSAVWKLVIER